MRGGWCLVQLWFVFSARRYVVHTVVCTVRMAIIPSREYIQYDGNARLLDRQRVSGANMLDPKIPPRVYYSVCSRLLETMRVARFHHPHGRKNQDPSASSNLTFMPHQMSALHTGMYHMRLEIRGTTKGKAQARACPRGCQLYRAHSTYGIKGAPRHCCRSFYPTTLMACS